ncbi:putative holin-like toxin [Enterococcus faecalis]|nr:putative holin-like toxin [Enterococcus faecalis]MCH1672946.1 putative holin-like toxin [Enterococcus faecalis]
MISFGTLIIMLITLVVTLIKNDKKK